MDIKVAETAGFCYGVARAVKIAEDCPGRYPGRRVYTYGPVVHNETVTAELRSRGIAEIPDREHLERAAAAGELAGAVLILRAHGIGDAEKKRLSGIPGLILEDTVCPFVEKIHCIARQAGREGRPVIIAGDPAHPEVKGIAGCVAGSCTVVSSPEEAENLRMPVKTGVTLVCQTTFRPNKFEEIVDILRKRLYDICVVNTVCNATRKRQSEAAELSRVCDAMIVIGSRASSNTAKLYEICRSLCGTVHYIQCVEDLSRVAIGSSVRCIGITAGASTPKTIIEEVVNHVRTEF